MSVIKFLSLLTLATCLVGCRAKYEDVTSEQEFASLVGKSFVVKGDWIIHGVSDSYDPPIDYFVITPRPGFTGPEVLSRRSMTSGTILRVDAVRRCTNCVPSSVRFLVSISEMKSPSAPIFVDVDDLKNSRFTDEYVPEEAGD